MNIKEIKQLIAAMDQSGMDRLEVQDADFKLVLCKEEKVVQTTVMPAAPQAPAMAAAAAPVSPQPVQPPAAPEGETKDHLVYVTSPIVGTFYAAPAPDEPPFVQVGDRVTQDDVVGIIEAMKLMNEIQAGTAGVVREILVANEDGVEYGQRIVAIDPRA